MRRMLFFLGLLLAGSCGESSDGAAGSGGTEPIEAGPTCTDLCAHDRQPLAKRDFIGLVDRALEPLLDEDLVLAVTADHTTDSNTGAHTGDPVPTVLRVPWGSTDGCTAFGERVCRQGGLGRITATALLGELVASLDRPAKRSISARVC